MPNWNILYNFVEEISTLTVQASSDKILLFSQDMESNPF